ncbi:LysM domain-containing protein [Paenarthrobacter sp. S56]|uniref:LysM peptidoglycan-binding domain-containing protein n=1 Tax=Paenarthrobacter sp. S56 TaxID=3138179 RepID=UPI003219D7BA
MDSTSRRDAALASVVLMLGFALALAGRLIAGGAPGMADPTQAFAFERLVGISCSVLGLAVVAWWLLSLATAFIAALLQRSGRSKEAAIVSKGSPAFMLRLVLALLSINLLSASGAYGETVPEPAWHSSAPRTSTAAQPQWKATPRTILPGWKPSAPAPELGLLGRKPDRQSPSDLALEAEVVAPGDTLWSIAARRSGPLADDVDVALNWPKWYAANKAVIGDDPSVLRPGQVLQPPPPG